MNALDQTITEFVHGRNSAKKLFTAGPASLLPENLTGLRPCFGRGDADYAEVETSVLETLRAMSGHERIVRLQGSASLALEIMALNFLYGRVLVVLTGYYAERLDSMVRSAMRCLGQVTEVTNLDWRDMSSTGGAFDWVVACYTETSRGLKVPISELRALAQRLGARLMLDATASIGLELGHEMADVIGYSSCKGLFGLTGAAFIAYNDGPSVEVDSFYLRFQTHADKMMTGPYHAICSLAHVLPKYEVFRSSVVENKKAFLGRIGESTTVPMTHQPILCTHVDREVGSKDPETILYKSRSAIGGSVVCHLGEAHLEREAYGAILDALELSATSLAHAAR